MSFIMCFQISASSMYYRICFSPDRHCLQLWIFSSLQYLILSLMKIHCYLYLLTFYYVQNLCHTLYAFPLVFEMRLSYLSLSICFSPGLYLFRYFRCSLIFCGLQHLLISYIVSLLMFLLLFPQFAL